MPKTYPQDLLLIREEASGHEAENERFRAFLQLTDQETIDKLVFDLNINISSKIDCTTCGNCCRSFMINVSEPEIEKIAGEKNLDPKEAMNVWVEKGIGGMMIINSIPCHFLSDNKCTVYDSRFEGCREFPHLHKPNFTTRFFTVMMNYAICPITYHVVEELKVRLGFEK